MSEINFIACDSELEELANDSKMLIGENNSILALKNRKRIMLRELYLPSISLIPAYEYEDYNIDKKYVYRLDYRWNKESVEVLLDYFNRNMKKTDEIEFWSIWLDDTEDYSDKIQKKVLINNLNYEYMNCFYEYEHKVKCLVILNKFY